MKEQFTNPIIEGFYPDPSICRVGNDYYMVNSSFEYFPAIPVWHSEDLVNWKQIGNAIDRKSQGLNLDVNISGGVQACTIRYHKGTFYIISTCVGKTWPSLKYNFIISACDPSGPWSDVCYLDDVPGIDSSLFFDDDDKCYIHGNVQLEHQVGTSDATIWIQEFNIKSLKVIGEKVYLWSGTGGQYPEGPHIYKRNEYYYLLVAEGGTGHFHTLTMARSKNIYGPYIGSPRNPILSHKHLSKTYPIQNVGHGDFVETPNGDWYIVCLGVRPRGEFIEPIEGVEGSHLTNLGRETFLAPVEWSDDLSPTISPLTGKIEQTYPLASYQNKQNKKDKNTYTFEYQIPQEIVSIRSDINTLCKIDKGLSIALFDTQLSKDEVKTWVGIRQTSWNQVFETSLSVEDNTIYGVCAYINYNNYIAIQIKNNEISIIVNRNGNATVVQTFIVKKNPKYFKIEVNDFKYTFSYGFKKDTYIATQSVTGDFLNSHRASGHTGTFYGIFGSSAIDKNMKSNFIIVENVLKK